MKNYFITTLFLFVLSGCNGNSTGIWSDESQRIQIIKDNGNVPSIENRYVEYDYSLDTLSTDALNKISNIKTTKDNLFCSNDGVTYEIIITDGNGMLTTYVSNNRDCGRENETSFVTVDSVQSIIDSL